eukprot:12449558-Prorocentrum_lima.AAC.1
MTALMSTSVSGRHPAKASIIFMTLIAFSRSTGRPWGCSQYSRQRYANDMKLPAGVNHVSRTSLGRWWKYVFASFRSRLDTPRFERTFNFNLPPDITS